MKGKDVYLRKRTLELLEQEREQLGVEVDINEVIVQLIIEVNRARVASRKQRPLGGYG
jgi:hypothetical protein